MSLGMVYIFTGEGKGKTSAALGTLVRALAHGWAVGWVSWYKESSWRISEHKLDAILSHKTKQRLHFFSMGKGFYIPQATTQFEGKKYTKAHDATIIDHAHAQEHKQSAQDALMQARSLFSSCDVVVMDEVCNAIADGLLRENDVVDVLRMRKEVHVILTGRYASPTLCKEADLVSEITKHKHPFDKGKLAVKGLDF